jgi:hypothetical protein
MKSKLKRFKRELLLGSAAGLLVIGLVKLSEFHSSKVEQALVQGCDRMASIALNPLLQPSCLMINGKLAVNIGLVGKTYDLETGNEILSE